jgi:hypothetical protein
MKAKQSRQPLLQLPLTRRWLLERQKQFQVLSSKEKRPLAQLVHEVLRPKIWNHCVVRFS